MTLDQMKNHALVEIEELLRGNGSSLKRYPGMPIPDELDVLQTGNSLIFDEKNYNRTNLQRKHQEWIATITLEQRQIYDTILHSVNNEIGGMFFVYGFGGTGKTYLWKILGAALRSKGHIVLNVASSGIAALLLHGGHTAHSRFGIPINVDEFTTCSIQSGSDLDKLIIKAKLIIWDEAPMMNKNCFETLDRSMRDILRCDKPFGGKSIVFGGDFRQIFPVITEGGMVQTMMASLSSYVLWRSCTVLQLTQNMRLLSGSGGSETEELRKFSEWILDVGDSKINAPNKREVEIEIPEYLLITGWENPIEAIVKEVYGSEYGKKTDPNFYKKRAILSPTNQDVDTINEYMMKHVSGVEKTYLSSDSIKPSDRSNTNIMVYTEDFLNSIKVPCLPNHKLCLKVGVPIMLLRNIDPKAGLCNGTRLLITKLDDHVIGAKVINGDKVRVRVFLSRMYVTPPEVKFPFRMRRKQFPIVVALAMTVNKSQCKTLDNVGLYLPRPVFTHGQLYVAISRVKSMKGLKIVIVGSDGKPASKTMNVVYTEVFKNLKPRL